MYRNLTRPLSEKTEVYPGDRAFSRTIVMDFPADEFRLSEFSMSAHNGTHIDSPAHYIPDGLTVESMPENLMTGPATVCETAGDIPAGTERAILTRDFPLDADSAKRLIRLGVRFLAVPGLSVGDAETHRILLGGGCWICENADTEGLTPGLYEAIAVPLRIEGMEGAPAVFLARRLMETPPS